MPCSSKCIKLLLLLVSISLFGFAQQNWTRVNGAKLNSYITSLCTDTLRDRLYIGGDYKYNDGLLLKGICQWDGASIQPMGCGVGHCGGNYCSGVRDMVLFNGDLYSLYSSDSMDCRRSFSVARWDGSNWMSLNQEYFYKGVPSYPTSIFSFDSILVVNGMIDSILNMTAHGQIQYDGISWKKFLYCPLFQDDILGMYQIINYKGIYYAFNQEHDTLGNHQNFSRWNGTCWEKVPGVFSSFNMTINRMVVYQGDLYVAGIFSKYLDPLAPGNNIARFNGSQWDDVGGGVERIAPGVISGIYDLTIHDGYLYAVGNFDKAGGILSSNIARWDGSQWCSFGNIFDNTITAAASFHDSLFIAGGFFTIDGDSLEYLAKWTGGNFTDSCSAPVSVREFDGVKSLRLFPNPTQNTLSIISDDHLLKSWKIFSVLGRQIDQADEVNSKQIFISTESLTPGLYFLSIETIMNQKLVKRFVKN